MWWFWTVSVLVLFRETKRGREREREGDKGFHVDGERKRPFREVVLLNGSRMWILKMKRQLRYLITSVLL